MCVSRDKIKMVGLARGPPAAQLFVRTPPYNKAQIAVVHSKILYLWHMKKNNGKMLSIVEVRVEKVKEKQTVISHSPPHTS